MLCTPHWHDCMRDYMTRNKYNYVHIYILCTYLYIMYLQWPCEYKYVKTYILCTCIDAPCALLSWLQAWLHDYKYIEICSYLCIMYLHECSARVIVMIASVTAWLHIYKNTHISIYYVLTQMLCTRHFMITSVTTWLQLERYRYTHLDIYTYKYLYYIYTWTLYTCHDHDCKRDYMTTNKQKYVHIYIQCTYSDYTTTNKSKYIYISTYRVLTLTLHRDNCYDSARDCTTRGWQRCIRCLKLQASSRNRATNYRALLRKMT